jgi:hypothetical protein
MKMMNILTRFIFLIPAFFYLYTSSQNYIRKGNELFHNGNFEEAIHYYEEALKEEPDNPKILYRLGVSYLNANVDKSLAVPYLEKLIKIEQQNLKGWYMLGRAYQFAYEFDQAIQAFQKYKELDPELNEFPDVDLQIQYCYNAKELIKFPIDVTFINLGNNVNSIYDDYYPFIDEKENFLLFNTRRDIGESPLPNGKYDPNIFYSKFKKDGFSKSKKVEIAKENKYISKEIVGLSEDGKRAILYLIDLKGNGDLYIGEFDGKSIDHIKKLDKPINSKYYEEIAACISPSGNEIYFASNRPGGYGGTDIYVSRLLPTGKWGPPQNLGPIINSDQNEDFPNLSPDGKTLYFSSKGHASMGGYDIFKAEWDPVKRTWIRVKNIGFPINTPGDDMNFRVSKSGRYGYYSTIRKENLGGYDIYRVIFNEIEPSLTVIIGYVKKNNEQLKDYFITATDLHTGNIYGEYLPNPNSGRFIMILPPGKYEVFIDVPEEKPIVETIQILDKETYKSEIRKDFILK